MSVSIKCDKCGRIYDGNAEQSVDVATCPQCAALPATATGSKNDFLDFLPSRSSNTTPLRFLEKKNYPKKSANRSRKDNRLTTGDLMIAAFLPGVGVVVGLIYFWEGKPKAARMIGIAILFTVVIGYILSLVH
jgi:hypothetical protein